MGITTFFKNIFSNTDKSINTVVTSNDSPFYAPLDLLNSIYNRISTDVSLIDIKHCKIDSQGRFIDEINSSLNQCLKLSANIDQTGKVFIKDLTMTMLIFGSAVIVPIEYTVVKDSSSNELKDIETMRIGYVEDWYTDKVKVSVYDEKNGNRRSVILDKVDVAIIENPFYSIMNKNNSILRRLKEKTRLMDNADYNNYSKLDLLFKMPYSSKSDISGEKAKKRFSEIREQLSSSNIGAAYLEINEDVVQLNRPINNALLEQVNDLTRMLYSQLGMTQGILEGTADERTMTNYYSRIIEPILINITDEIKRKFLSKYAIINNETILYFRDPFKLVPVSVLAEIADKFTRNEILSSNEIRQKIGTKPSDDPKADKLINSNLNQSKETIAEYENKEV